MIELSLKNLTPEKIEQAIKSRQTLSESCRYSTPCIIGTLMSPEDIEYLKEQSYDNVLIGILFRYEEVTIPGESSAEEEYDMRFLQSVFDNSILSADEFREVATHFMRKYND